MIEPIARARLLQSGRCCNCEVGVLVHALVHVLAAASALALAACLAGPASAAITVNIDKNSQAMTVGIDGAQRYVWPVSTGRPGYDTPNGTFKPNRMDADPLSQEWDNAPMPHSIFFDMNGLAIHGFFNIKRLGSPVSHGCVRLSPDHAATLFKLVSTEGMKETTVVVARRRRPDACRKWRGGKSPRNRRRKSERPTDADRTRIPAAGAARLRVGPAARLRAAAGLRGSASAARLPAASVI